MRNPLRSWLVAGCAALLALSACGSSDDDGDDQAQDPTPSQSSPAGSPTPSPPPTAAPPIRTTDGPCPYVDLDTVTNTVGQRLVRSTVTSTSPRPSCTFYRPDEKPAASIGLSVHKDAPTAQTAALKQVGANANPVSGLGDFSVGAVTEDGAVVATTFGTTLIVVTINQQSTLQAKELAGLVLAKL